MKIILKGLAIALILSATTLKAQFSVSIQVNQNINCYGDANGSLTASVTPAGSTYTFVWSNGDNTASISNLSAGAYVVTVQNAAGGSAIATAVLSEPAALVLTSLTELPLNVNPTGSVDVETTGGTVPYAFQWVYANNIPFSNEEDLLDAPAGVYTQTATDAHGCTAVLTPVTLVATSGTADLADAAIKAFPNPVSNNLVIEIPAGGIQQVQIFNAMGQLVETQLLLGPQDGISVEAWSAGSYSLVFPGLSKTIKVLVTR